MSTDLQIETTTFTDHERSLLQRVVPADEREDFVRSMAVVADEESGEVAMIKEQLGV